MNFSYRKLIFNFAGFSFFQSWVINQGFLHFSIQKKWKYTSNVFVGQIRVIWTQMENLIKKTLSIEK